MARSQEQKAADSVIASVPETRPINSLTSPIDDNESLYAGLEPPSCLINQPYNQPSHYWLLCFVKHTDGWLNAEWYVHVTFHLSWAW